MTLIANAAKRKIQAGELALGFGVYHLRTAATAMLARATGHDWLFIDMEHGAFSLQETTQLCLAALPTGVTPLVRIASGALDEGTRALDGGAMGIVVPHVETVTQAKLIAEAFRYPPQGSRSWGGPPSVYGFLSPGNAEAQAALNDSLLIVAMIESDRGVRNAPEIAGVDGIDVLLIGTNDLSADLGISGQFGHPRIAEAYGAVAAACRTQGRILGMGGVYDQDTAANYVKAGARLIIAGSDHSYLMSGAGARTRFLRSLGKLA
jgi:2-keto-3-deoxy-L-rhamnonate aldolase RhmA